MSGFSVLENVLVGLHLHIPSNPFLHFWGGSRSPDRQAVEEARKVLRLLDLDDFMLSKVETLTFGQQRFVEIARALVGQPKLLLLDEPAAGLSPAEVDGLGNLLRMLQKKWGLTILLVEHVLSLVMATCERVTVLDRGRIIAEGTASEIASDPTVRTAYLGEEHGHA
jgi:branched-chain amino acid transport system ATP-binding protein